MQRRDPLKCLYRVRRYIVLHCGIRRIQTKRCGLKWVGPEPALKAFWLVTRLHREIARETSHRFYGYWDKSI